MISFETPLTLKSYFLASWTRMLNSLFDVFMGIFIVFMLILSIFYFNDRLLRAIWIFIPLFFLILLPLIKFTYNRFYFKAKTMHIFFEDKEFGYKIGGYTVSVEKEKIKSLKLSAHYILAKLQKGQLLFIMEKKDAKRISEELKSSSYAKFIVS